jgi:hypothetical protein
VLLFCLLNGIYPPRNKSTLGGAVFFALIVGAPLVAAGCGTLWMVHRPGVSDEPAVQMNARGLSIPKLYEERIPWSEITDVVGVNLIIRDGARFKPTALRVAETSWCNVPAKLLDLLDVLQKELINAIQAHRAHFGNGGQSG